MWPAGRPGRHRRERQADRQVNGRSHRIAPAAIRTWNVRLLETQAIDGGHRQAAEKDRSERAVSEQFEYEPVSVRTIARRPGTAAPSLVSFARPAWQLRKKSPSRAMT